MIYDLTNALDKVRFKTRCNYLYEIGASVEMTEKKVRTLSQNAYLHLVIGIVAMETGNTLEYTKQEYYKRLVNRELYCLTVQDKFAGQIEVLRSSTELTKEEMSRSIDKFVRWATENGMAIPSPEDESLLHQAEIAMGRMEKWL